MPSTNNAEPNDAAKQHLLKNRKAIRLRSIVIALMLFAVTMQCTALQRPIQVHVSVLMLMFDETENEEATALLGMVNKSRRR